MTRKNTGTKGNLPKRARRKKVATCTKPTSNTEPDGPSSPVATSKGVFPIVGIGSSAGGLAAIEAFFSAMPLDPEVGMSFVLVQHLSPDHKSILSELVRRYIRMQVYDIEDGMEIKPNCTYIIPPNRDMALLNGTLHLLEPTAPRGHRLPIDFFFRSLAQDQRERAICIVLSGNGSDGTLGVRAVKGEGGMVMVQSPASAEYDGMPQSAIATGLVDSVLTPAEMPAQLIAYVTHSFGKRSGSVSAPTPYSGDTLKKICVLLRSHAGHDFSQYKESTLFRCVKRRMAIHQIEQPDDYLRYLQKNPAEIEALFRDLLIGVTSFFRDPEAFAVLESQVIPRLFAMKPEGGSIRVWVCGCSTGDEAYSIAILLQEHLETLNQTYKVRVFATDIDRQAVEQARSGTFTASIAADVSPKRLARFFSHDPDGSTYRIQKVIRDLVIFSEQDLVNDPPFSKLNLICCRNLLIYMNSELQKRIIPLFHYALNPGGVLFLGSSETVGSFTMLFSTMDRKWKIYLRRSDLPGAAHTALGAFLPQRPEGETHPPSLKGPGRCEVKASLRELTEQALLQHYVQTAVLINLRGEILHIYGRAGKYLEPAIGEATMNILPMAREGLLRELTTALHKVASSEEPVCHSGLRVKTNGEFITVNLTVKRVTAGDGGAESPELLLVLLEEVQLDRHALSGESAAGISDQSSAGPDACVATLEQELRAKEEHLHITLEEMQTSNEELRSINEEMQSVNEELQSTNEELETSKEELQSVNEELATVNAELQAKVAELSRANDDMNNLLAGTGIGTLFVDLQLRITRFTPAATEVINLIQTDVSRPAAHIASNLVGYDCLIEDVKTVLDSLTPVEVEVQTKAGAWYLMRIRPYRTLGNVIEGVVITFVDISKLKETEEKLRRAQDLQRLAVVLRDSNDAITVQGMDGSIRAWNRGAARMYGWSEAEALAMNISATIPEAQREEAKELVWRLQRGEVVDSLKTKRQTKDDRILDVWLTVTRLTDENGVIHAIATTERDVSGLKTIRGSIDRKKEKS